MLGRACQVHSSISRKRNDEYASRALRILGPFCTERNLIDIDISLIGDRN